MSSRTLLLTVLAAVAGFAGALGIGWALSDRSPAPAAPAAVPPSPIPDPGGIPVRATLADVAPIPDLQAPPPVVVTQTPSAPSGSAPSTSSGGSSAPSTSGGSSPTAPSGGGSTPAPDPGVFDSQ